MKFPVGVVASVCTVIVDVPEPTMELGLNVATAPEGNPVTDIVAVALYPFRSVTVAVYATALPLVTDCEVGETERVNPVTDSATVVVC